MRNYKLDSLKFFSAIVIVLIHTNSLAPSVRETDIYTFLNTVTRFAVPLFFVISGYLYVSSSNKLKIIYRNFVLWLSLTVLYAVINAIISPFVDFTYMNIFWFMKVLVILQVLTLWNNRLWYSIVMIISIGLNLLVTFELQIISLTLPFIPLFIVSMHLNNHQFNKLKSNWLGISVLVVAIIIQIVNGLFIHKGQYDYLMSITAILIFIGVMVLDVRFKKYNVYNTSFALYIYHIIVIRTIFEIGNYYSLFTFNYYLVEVVGLVAIAVILIIVISSSHIYTVFKTKYYNAINKSYQLIVNIFN